MVEVFWCEGLVFNYEPCFCFCPEISWRRGYANETSILSVLSNVVKVVSFLFRFIEDLEGDLAWKWTSLLLSFLLAMLLLVSCSLVELFRTCPWLYTGFALWRSLSRLFKVALMFTVADFGLRVAYCWEVSIWALSISPVELRLKLVPSSKKALCMVPLPSLRCLVESRGFLFRQLSRPCLGRFVVSVRWGTFLESCSL